MSVSSNKTDKAKSNPVSGAPILAGAVLLFALSLLVLVQSVSAPPLYTTLVTLAIPTFPVTIALVAYRVGRVGLANWLWGSFIISILIAGLHLLDSWPLIPPAQIWGTGTVLALGLAGLFRSSICLILSGIIASGWIWLSYHSFPSTDFLWPFLLVFCIGLALAVIRNNQIAAIVLALDLLMWSLFSAQAAISIRFAAPVQIALLFSLFLLVSALLSPAAKLESSGKMPWHRVILFVGSALAAGFSGTSMTGISQQISHIPTLHYQMSLAAILLALGITTITFSNIRVIDQIGVLALFILLALGIFALPELVDAFWVPSVGAGLLSLAGIWMAARGFAAQDTRAGLTGLGIWGVAVLLSSYDIEQQWIRTLVMGLYSLVAVGFYVKAETQAKIMQRKNQSAPSNQPNI